MDRGEEYGARGDVLDLRKIIVMFGLVMLEIC